jgi:hypothetical protein
MTIVPSRRGSVPGSAQLVVRPVAGGPGRGARMARRLWTWLTTCAEEGCSNRPDRLGWCSQHGVAYDPAPDEYWA